MCVSETYLALSILLLYVCNLHDIAFLIMAWGPLTALHLTSIIALCI